MHILAYSVYICTYKSRAAWREAQKGNREKEQSVTRKNGERRKDMNVMKEEDTGGDNIKSRKNRLTKICSDIRRLETNCLSKGNKVHRLPLVCQNTSYSTPEIQLSRCGENWFIRHQQCARTPISYVLEEFVVICVLYETWTELRQTLSIPLIYFYFPVDSRFKTLFHMVIGHFDFLFLELSLYFYQPTG